MRLGIFILSFSIGCAELSAMGNINQVPQQTIGVKRHAPTTIESLDTASQAERKITTAEMATQTEPQRRGRQEISNQLDQQLIDAVKAGNFEQVQALFSYKRVDIPDINVRDVHPVQTPYLCQENNQLKGMTPLMIAAAYNRPAIVEFLLWHGADLNIQTEGGFTALNFALEDFYDNDVHQGEIPRMLINAGIDVSLGDPLANIFFNDQEVIQLIVAGGADLNANTILGRINDAGLETKQQREIFQIFIEGGMDIKGTASDGSSILMYPLSRNDGTSAFIKYLLDKGANPYIRDKYGQNAFDLANRLDITGENRIENLKIQKLLADFDTMQTPQHKQALREAAQKALGGSGGMQGPARIVQEFLRPTLPGCAERQQQLQQQNQEKKEKEEKANKSDLVEASTDRERMNDDTN